jgi:hypothetical protein
MTAEQIVAAVKSKYSQRAWIAWLASLRRARICYRAWLHARRATASVVAAPMSPALLTLAGTGG